MSDEYALRQQRADIVQRQVKTKEEAGGLVSDLDKIDSLRAQLAEVERERGAFLGDYKSICGCRYSTLNDALLRIQEDENQIRRMFAQQKVALSEARATISELRAINVEPGVSLGLIHAMKRERDEARAALATAIKEGCSCDLLYGVCCHIHRLETTTGVKEVMDRLKALEKVAEQVFILRPKLVGKELVDSAAINDLPDMVEGVFVPLLMAIAALQPLEKGGGDAE